MIRPRLAATLVIGICLSHSPVIAAIEADFITTAGTITVDLAHQQAPLTVANLITLAEGTRPWIDPLTGNLSTSPFFDGLPFLPLPDGAGGMLAATGTRTGDGSDDPGYTFPDEITLSLTHQAYTLTMISPGPNRNGACLGFTGPAAVPERDGYSTVVGSVTDPASRGVIDTILSSPAGTVTITGITIRRTDPAAEAFDETAQSLPTMTALAPALQVVPGISSSILHPLQPARELRAHSSTDLSSWTPWLHRFLGSAESSPGPTVIIDEATAPTRFYRFSEVTYPAPTGTSSLAGQTLTLETEGAGTLIYQFDSTGQSGTYENIVFGMPFFAGSFELRQEIPPFFGPYSFEILLYLYDEELGNSPFNHIRAGLDTAGSGRHVVTFLGSSLNFVFKDKGSLQLVDP